jgi:hypothetical protein
MDLDRRTMPPILEDPLISWASFLGLRAYSSHGLCRRESESDKPGEEPPPLKPIRVLLLGMPTMLREIVRRIAEDAPGLDVIAELPDANIDSPEILRAEPDVVITGADRISEDAVTNLLRRRHAIRILGISADARQVALHELRPQRVPLGELAPAMLVAAIRGGRPHES